MVYEHLFFQKERITEQLYNSFVYALNIYGRMHNKVITLVAYGKRNWEAEARAMSKRETSHCILFYTFEF